MTEAEPIPCPFCGHSDNVSVFGLQDDQWWVECSGYDSGLCCKTFRWRTKDEAVQHWNTRTPADVQERARRAAQQIVDLWYESDGKVIQSMADIIAAEFGGGGG